MPADVKERCPVCGCFQSDLFLAKAINKATKSFVHQKKVLVTIRNGGWEQSFRNRVLEISEDCENAIGFLEASERVEATGRTVSRIDLLYRCQDCSRCLLAAETKTNFFGQKLDDERLDACLKLHPLLEQCPGYLVYAVTDLCHGDDSRLVKVHNKHVPKYKRFVIGQPRELPADDMFYNVPPTAAEERQFRILRVRVRVRVWLARCVPARNEGLTLKFLNQTGASASRRAVKAEDLMNRLADRQR